MTAPHCIFIWPDETTGGHQNWFKGCYRAEPRRPLDAEPTGTPYVPKALVDELVAENERLRAQVAGLREEVDIDAIERAGSRWHGEDHRIVAVRWEPYKPDGQRQMKAKGRWQEQVGSGDYWRWQNCERPAALSEARAQTAATVSEGEKG